MRTKIELGSLYLISENYQDSFWLVHFYKNLDENKLTKNIELNFDIENRASGSASWKDVDEFFYDDEEYQEKRKNCDWLPIDYDNITSLEISPNEL